MMHDTTEWPDFADPDDDFAGCAAWTDEAGRFFMLGGDGVVREYGDGPEEEARMRVDYERAPIVRQAAPLLPRPAGIRLPPRVDHALADEWRRSLAILTAAILTATAIAALIDTAGTAAIVADLFSWWLL